MRVPRKTTSRRSYLLAALLPLIGAPAVQAADYPVLRGSQIEQPVEPPADMINWGGFYLGGGAGFANAEFEPGTRLRDLAAYGFANTVLQRQGDLSGLVPLAPKRDDSGAFYHLYAGYNVTFDDVVLGFEADYNRTDYGYAYGYVDAFRRYFFTPAGVLNQYTFAGSQSATLEDYATARIRAGWTYGRFMPFGTIGVAAGRFNTNSTLSATVYQNPADPTGVPLAPVSSIKRDAYSFGFVFGAGLDVALTENILLRGEYQHVRFADVEGVSTVLNVGRVSAAVKF